jgi:enoyl-CoA hydratase/carnithine racemase
MSEEQTILWEKSDGIAWITLNRPGNLNVYSVRMRDELYETLTVLRDDDEIRVAVFTGAGNKAFCAGADLSEFLTASSPMSARQSRWQRDIWGLLLKIPQPLIAALHGYVLGSGLEIALCCDLRFAADNCRFGLPETGLGIIPAAGGTQTVPRAIGRANALEMLLGNRWVDSTEAHRIGLVNRVVPAERLLTEVTALASRLATLPQETIRLAKRTVVEGLDMPLAAGLKHERRLALQAIAKRAGESRH